MSSNPAVQLAFTLRTSPNVRTVHLLGSWDNYKNQLPLSIVQDSKPGSWKGTFRFVGSHVLKLGARYWYYYIVDGYHVSHDPAIPFTTEPTTGRKLNILDVPGSKSSATAASGPKRPTVHTNVNRHSREVPQGRALSPGKIQHPKPSKPYASRQIREADYEVSPVDELTDRFSGTKLSGGYDSHDLRRHAAAYSSSPSALSDGSSSSGTSFSASYVDSDERSSPSSMSSVSDRSCHCERYGITRSGQRVKLDCGGVKCGYSSSECSSSDGGFDDDSSEDERHRRRGVATKKPAPVVVQRDRHGREIVEKERAREVDRRRQQTTHASASAGSGRHARR